MAAGDLIELRGLRVAGIVGVLPQEQAQAQPLEVDLDVAPDLAAAGASDDLADTVDYGALCAVVEQVVTDHALRAARGAGRAHRRRRCSAPTPGSTSVTVAVRKLRPPVAQQLDTSGVRITRARGRDRGPSSGSGSNLGDRVGPPAPGRRRRSPTWSRCRRSTRPTRSVAPTTRAPT